MGLLDALRCVVEVRKDIVRRYRPTTSEHALQVRPSEHLRDEDGLVLEFGRHIRIDDPDDMLAADARVAAGLAREPGPIAGVAGLHEHDLQRKSLASVLVFDLVHRAHAAASEFSDDAVLSADDSG
jgi:hypothetical protein